MATPEGILIENMLQIVDKDGNDVPFRLNNAQRGVDHNLTGRDVIPKARQEGVSSYFLGRYTIRCLTKQNTRAVVISHDTESTQRMLAKVHYFLKNIKGPKPVLKNLSKNEITFPKTNSVFYIGTAGSRQFGRGDTITNLHCSEVAFWSDPKKLLAGLFQAVPLSGEIAMESTGNGVGNYYHRTCTRAAGRKGQFHLHFLSWTTFPEYTLDMSLEQELALLSNLDEDLEEPFLVEKMGLTAGQIAWRRTKIEEMDYDIQLFKQEYPMTLDECFQSTGKSIFHRVKYVPTEEWRQTETSLWELAGHPRPGEAYSLGADPSGGVGKDNSVVQIVNAATLEQVAEWASDRCAPDVFAEKVAWLGQRYNNALAAVESNNHGIVTLKELLDLYSSGRVVRGERTDTILDYGLRTTVQTKPLMIGRLRKMLVQQAVIHSALLRDELATFVEKENGSLEADEGCLDDRVMAMALAIYVSVRALTLFENEGRELLQGHFDPFTLDAIIEEMGNRGSGIPISKNLGVLEA